MSGVDSSTSKSKGNWRGTRLIALGLLLLAYAVGAIWFYRECSTVQTMQANGDKVVELSCVPPSLSSATVVILVLFAILLLWPDLSEISVMGVSLKRRLEAAEAQAEEAREGVAALNSTIQIQQVRIDSLVTATASATANITTNLIAGSETRWSEREAKDLTEAYLQMAEEGASNQDVEQYQESLDTLKIRLLSEYEELVETLGLYPRGPRRAGVRDSNRRREAQQSFIEDYREAFQSVRALRNAVAHAQDVDQKDVIEALGVISALLPKAKDWMSLFEGSL